MKPFTYTAWNREVRRLHAAWADIVLDPYVQGDGPDSYTEDAYGTLACALMTDGRTIARAFGRGGWEGCDSADPYPDVWAMIEACADGACIQISDVNHNGAMLGNDSLNLLFRAHHDAVHVINAFGFNLAEECEVAADTVERLGLDVRTAAIVASEIIGQSLHVQCTDRFPLVDGRQPFTPACAEIVAWAMDAFDTLCECSPFDPRKDGPSE